MLSLSLFVSMNTPDAVSAAQEQGFLAQTLLSGSFELLIMCLLIRCKVGCTVAAAGLLGPDAAISGCLSTASAAQSQLTKDTQAVLLSSERYSL
jgi:hypothetical protein